MTGLRLLFALRLREQSRRPLAWLLLVIVPVVFITRAIARTQPIPRTIALPGGELVTTSMRSVHGASMAGITVAFLGGLVGVFVLPGFRGADRRLIVAGLRRRSVVAGRMAVMAVGVGLVLVSSLAVTAVSFTPESWPVFALGGVMTGTVFGLLGAVFGLVFGSIAATYLLLFAAMLDLGIAQNPMFGSGTPPSWAKILPGYTPGRITIDGAFGDAFHAGPHLVRWALWVASLGIVLAVWVRRPSG